MKKNIEATAIVFNFLLLAFGYLLVVLFPDTQDRVVAWYLLGLNVLQLAFWFLIFNDKFR